MPKNMQRWQWGKVHRHTFVSPIRQKGFGKGLLGGRTHATAGSGEALYRGIYTYNDSYVHNQSYAVTASAALRMVADLADHDKVLAVMAGGVAERVFHAHATDQIAPFVNGEKVYWWFSDQEIANHTRSVMMLTP